MGEIKNQRVLVAVASKHGSTHEIAEVIARELRAASFVVEVCDLHSKSQLDEIGEYSAVILGSAIYAGSWLPQAKHFAEQHRAALSKVPVWLFSSGPLGKDDPHPQDDPARLTHQLAGLKAHDHQIFVGKLDLTKLNLAERMITRLVKAPAGDFRDWETIKNWAQEITRVLRAETLATGTLT